ncbi:amidase [Herbidospora mongoliensis]|uniref:amidase n=1 Tax=Herbidospora mongoliensis TaxID=688067 RepID=UPI00082EC8CE|nr:amidase family protein [Herbidospora mongoliensis]
MSWAGRTAVEIADAVRAGEATAEQVVADHLEAVAARDGAIGAFRTVLADSAMAEAKALGHRPDLPLAGVPVAIKDNVAVAGHTATNGSLASPASAALTDHPVVARLRAAGAIVIGLTKVPELCLYAFSETRNPWNPDRTAGGSSGGSAAAVASGMVPLALGNDGLGSLRIPAACCGVVALKPGHGMLEPPPHDWFAMAENGPLSTSVNDTILALTVMTGTPILPEAEDLRIAVAPNPLPPGFSVDAEFQEAVRAAGATLREAGHTVVDHGRRFPMSLGWSTIAAWYSCAAADAGDLDQRRLEGRTRSMARTGRLLQKIRRDGTRGRDDWRANGADLWFGDADVLITPTIAHLPPSPDGWASKGMARNAYTNITYAPLTGAWNMAGWPAMTLPFGRHSSGLPIGIQLIAPPDGEGMLLSLAGYLERARPWARHASLI